MSPPLTPDAAEARRQLAEELSKPIYADVQNWISDQLRKLMEWLSGDPDPSGALDSGQLSVVVVTAVVVVGIAVWAFMGPVRADRRRRRGAVFTDEQRSASQLREEAARLATADDWGLATVEQFRALVRSLAERAVVDEFPGMTAHEAVGRAAPRFPAQAARLAAAADVFDGLAYGRRPGTAAQYTAMHDLDTEVAATRPTALPEPSGNAAVGVEVSR